MSTPRIIALCALLIAAPAAWAEPGPIDETRPLAAEGRLSVSNIAGSIEVIAWNREEVHVTGELGEGVEKLEISGGPSHLRIEVKVPKNARNVEESVLRLQVPVGARLELDAVSADISVQGVKGTLRANSVSGDVNLSVASAEVEAQTVSGDLTLRAPSRSTRVSTVSGDIHLSGVREKLHLETVSGDVQLMVESISDMQLKSVSGEFEIEVAGGGAPRIEAETLSGNITLHLPKEPDAELSLRTFSGELATRHGEPIEEGKKRYEAKLGSGKGRIDLNTFSGDIRVTSRKR